MELILLGYLTCQVNGQPGKYYGFWKPYIDNPGTELSTILQKDFPMHLLSSE